MAITAQITDTSRALQVLEGLLKGISCDNKIIISELKSLKSWLDNHKNFAHVFPFCEAYELVENVLEDGIITPGEHDELMDFCESYQSLTGPIQLFTMEMRNLHGFLHGIIADKKVTYDELKALEKWMLYHDTNSGKWPFDEIYQLVQKILKDGYVSRSEQAEFIEFVKGFIEDEKVNVRKDPTIFTDYWMQSDAPTLKTIDSIIDRNVAIAIIDKSFCFTGQMKNGRRKDIQDILSARGGVPVERVTRGLDYLVVGALSNPCWVYSTYGRKIESVISMNGNGASIAIVHEDDVMRMLR